MFVLLWEQNPMIRKRGYEDSFRIRRYCGEKKWWWRMDGEREQVDSSGDIGVRRYADVMTMSVRI